MTDDLSLLERRLNQTEAEVHRARMAAEDANATIERARYALSCARQAYEAHLARRLKEAK